MNLSDLENIIVSPDSGNSLKIEDGNIIDPANGHEYQLIDNVPSIMPKESKFDGGMDYHEHYHLDAEYSNYFQERDHGDTKHDERRLREYIMTKVPKDAGLILDVGSGGAWVAKQFCPKGKKVISFDLSSRNTSEALKKYSYDNHYAIIGDALNPPFRNESFDCIIASEIIEHTVEPGVFIKSMLNLIKPGGKLIVSTPYKEVIPYYLCVHCNKLTPRNAHLHSFDENKLEELNTDKNKYAFKYYTFGNKALTLLQTHILLKYLPFGLWKFIDSIANVIINKRGHIIAEYYPL